MIFDFNKYNFLLILLILSLSCVSVSAEENNQIEKINSIINKANKDTSLEIALSTIQSAIDLSVDINDNNKLARCYFVKANIFVNNMEYGKSLEYYNKSLELLDESSLDDYVLVIDVYYGFGAVYFFRGDYNKSLEYTYKSLAIAEHFNNKTEIVRSLSNIGSINERWGDYEQAMKVFKRALLLCENLEKPDKEVLSTLLTNIGLVYYKFGDKIEALKNYKKSLEFKREIGNKSDLATVLINIGVVYFENGNIDKAFESYNEALLLAKQIKEFQLMGVCYVNLADLNIINDNSLSLEYLKKSLDIALSFNYSDLLKDTYYSLYDLYKKQKESKEALNYYTLYISTKDSIFGKKNRMYIDELKIRYETEKKEKEILATEKEIEVLIQKEENQRTIRNITSVVSILIISLLLLTLRQRKKYLNEAQHRYKIEDRLKQEEKLRNKESLKREKEISKLHKKQLNEKISYQERELSIVSLYISQRNEVLEKIRKINSMILSKVNLQARNKLKEINNTINETISLREDWTIFKNYFTNVYPHFLDNIKTKFPQLTDNDLKICVYIKINLSNKDTARLLNITPRGMKSARNRLKKKLDLGPDDKLNKFVVDFMSI